MFSDELFRDTSGPLHPFASLGGRNAACRVPHGCVSGLRGQTRRGPSTQIRMERHEDEWGIFADICGPKNLFQTGINYPTNYSNGAIHMLEDTIRRALDPIIRHIGQSEAARRSGISQPALSKWLSGRQRLSIKRVEHLAATLGYHISFCITPTQRTRYLQHLQSVGEYRGVERI